MSNFVLVHGAWHGSWCWRDTARALRAQGHNVITPTLTGNGASAHLSSQSITLETHVRDVIGCIESEEVDDVVLCGHSYGGMVITQVANRIGERLKSLVYLDAFIPEHGDSLIGLLQKALEPEVAAQFVNGFRGSAQENASGMMAPIPGEVFNIKPENRAWVDRRCVPQALATFEMPVLLDPDVAAVTQRVYILADGWDPSPFRYFAKKVAAASGWTQVSMPSSHDVMVDMPAELAKELAALG